MLVSGSDREHEGALELGKRGGRHPMSAEEEDGRSARGREAERVGAGSGGGEFGGTSFRKFEARRGNGRLGMRRLRCRYPAAAIVTAAGDAADGAFFRFRGAVAMMGGAKAASVCGRSCGSQRQRKERSDKREQQEKSCGRALHSVL